MLQIRGGKFNPDATRYGRWVEHEATKVQRSRDAIEEATDEGEPQREAQARAHEREEDMDCEAPSDDDPGSSSTPGKRRVPRRSRLRRFRMRSARRTVGSPEMPLGGICPVST